jgi:SAM-dependent methyltransferase
MKLVDKMLLLTRMLRDNKQYTMDIETLVQTHQSYWQDQKRFWKNNLHQQELDRICQDIRDLKQEYDQALARANAHTTRLLKDETVEILQADYKRFDTQKPDFETQKRRIEQLDLEVRNVLSNEIGIHSDWRWAGVDLNPSDGFLTRAFLACDPFYMYTGQVIDKSAIKNRFNNFFSEKRLMFYDRLEHFPQGHIGLAVNINTYQFWPLDPIREEIKSVHKLLLPGGHFIFTYNDCEHLASLDFCANGYRAYNTRELMLAMVEMIGFEVIKEANLCNGAHSYMIVKKPGKLGSQKLSAPLVSIESPKRYAKGCAPGQPNYQPENHKK